jgi:hypothetical protein
MKTVAINVKGKLVTKCLQPRTLWIITLGMVIKMLVFPTTAYIAHNNYPLLEHYKNMFEKHMARGRLT